ncbi:DNA-binding transcriptional regulator HcaR [Acinetobacter sp. YH12023]|uniref:DNA-binding transcriptional regulator HcaR n=1 Tax=Acinetobacter sp. YH12023 TaxID=2601041 RepID=UPI0015D0FDFA|nr:DNA-binding transcriptional regulator HcaR [Acinetobacter sp. YH12023]
MELRHLKYFVMVAQELNFSQAALKFYTAQPSLSQQIKDLEEFIGVQLFIRSKRKVELTDEGIVFLEHAKNILESADKAVAMTRQVKKAKDQKITIGFVPVAEMKIFPFIIPKLTEIFPDLKVELLSLNDTQIVSDLHNGRIDIAISRADVNNHEISSQLIFEEPLIFLMNNQHPFANQNKISVKSLEEIDFIIPAEEVSSVLHHKILKFAEDKKINLKIIQRASNILFNINSINITQSCTILPSYIADIAYENIIVKKLDTDLPTINLYMSKRSTNTSPSVQAFINLINDFFHLKFD